MLGSFIEDILPRPDLAREALKGHDAEIAVLAFLPKTASEFRVDAQAMRLLAERDKRWFDLSEQVPGVY